MRKAAKQRVVEGVADAAGREASHAVMAEAAGIDMGQFMPRTK